MTVQAGPAERAAGTTTQTSWLAASGTALAAVLAANAISGGHRWWANFVLFPAGAMGAAAVPLLRRGRGRAAAGYALLCTATIVFVVGLLLLFGAMGRGWPLMIILPCLALAGTVRWRAPDPNARAPHHTVVGLASLGVALGATFLMLRQGVVDPGGVHWWGFFMIAAGAVALGNGLSLVTDLRGYRLSTTVLLAGLGAAAVLAGLRELLWR